LIGGVDISFVKDNNEDACASLIVMSFPDFKVRRHGDCIGDPVVEAPRDCIGDSVALL
jgi:hypothetical protein